MKTALMLLMSPLSNTFPPFDITHAHCQLTASVQGTCGEVWSSLDKTIRTMADPARGSYAVKEESVNEYVWALKNAG